MYAVLFFLMGVVLIANAVIHNGLYWFGVWPGVSFLLVSIAYAGAGPAIFGKRADGTLAPMHSILLLPYLILLWTTWHSARLLSREPSSDRIAPSLWLGRRPLPSEVRAGVDLIVDLTAEFPEPAAVRAGRTYWCLPVLDAGVPNEQAFDELVKRVAAWPGEVLIHCANGHGRSATLAAAVLVEKALTTDSSEAILAITNSRPGVRLKRCQRELLARWEMARRHAG